MNVYKLWWLLTKTILQGRGLSEVLFDTEAGTFEYHMAKIGDAYFEKHSWPSPAVHLYEAKSK